MPSPWKSNEAARALGYSSTWAYRKAVGLARGLTPSQISGHVKPGEKSARALRREGAIPTAREAFRALLDKAREPAPSLAQILGDLGLVEPSEAPELEPLDTGEFTPFHRVVSDPESLGWDEGWHYGGQTYSHMADIISAIDSIGLAPSYVAIAKVHGGFRMVFKNNRRTRGRRSA